MSRSKNLRGYAGCRPRNITSLGMGLDLSLGNGRGASSGSSTISAPFSQVNGPADGPAAGRYEGFTADYAVQPTIAANVAYTVDEVGYDTSGSGSTVSVPETRYVIKTAGAGGGVRKPWNLDAQQSALTALLSDYGYSTTTIGGGKTNNSTLTANKVMAQWADAPKQLLGAGLDIELVAFQKYGRNSKPVAAVVLRGTPTTGSAVDRLCTYAKSSKYGDNLPVWKPSTQFKDSDFPSNGDADVTISCVGAYPWIGGSTAVRDTSGGSFPSNAAFVPQVHRTVGPTVIYAYVDGLGAAPAVNANATLAALTPYATVTAALTGLYANIGGAAGGDISFSVIRMKAGAHTWDNTAPTGTTRTATKGWLTIEGDPADPNPYVNVTVATAGSNKTLWTGTTACWLKIQNLKLTITAATNLANFGGNRHGVWLNHVDFVTDATPWGAAGYQWATQCSGTGATAPFAANANSRFMLIRASTTNNTVTTNAFLSSTIDATGKTTTLLNFGEATHLSATNLIGHNFKVTNWAAVAGNLISFTINSATIKDIYLSQFLITGTGIGSTWSIDDHAENRIENLIIDYATMSSTTVGANQDICRINMHATPVLVNQPTTGVSVIPTYDRCCVMRSNFLRYATKHDIFSGSNDSNTGAALIIGGWQMMFGVGFKHNVSEYTFNLGQFAAEYFGLNSFQGQAITYTARGTDFRPTAGYAVIAGAAEQSLTWDIDGTFRDTAAGASGAYEHP